MSARREKRFRSLERRVRKLEVMASAGFLESNLREELAKVNNRPENAWQCRTPTVNIPQDAEYQQVQGMTVLQRLKWLFTGGVRRMSDYPRRREALETARKLELLAGVLADTLNSAACIIREMDKTIHQIDEVYRVRLEDINNETVHRNQAH